MCVVFDFDGVLVDTRSVVEHAYLDIGVTMPAGAWGKPWQSWLADPEAHARKTVRYLELIREGALDEHVLPPFHTMRKLITDGVPTYVLTGASREAVHAVLRRYLGTARWPMILGTNCDLHRKVEALLRWVKECGAISYVDDDRVVGEAIQRMCGDRRIRAVHYARYSGRTAKAEAERLHRTVTTWTE